jgi:hypothetical protein
VRRFLLSISWLVAIQTILLGLFAAALLTGTWVEPGLPTLVHIAMIVLGGFLPVVLSLVGLHDPRTAARFALPSAVLTLTALLEAILASGGSRNVALALALFILLIPGIIWKIAARFGWPLPLKKSPWPILARHSLLSVATLVGIFLMVVIGSLSIVPWRPPIGDCLGRSLLDEQGVPLGVDFTAKISFVGPSVPFGIFRRHSLWSLARVQERFGQKSFKIPRFIILRGDFAAAEQSQDYFVESTGGSNTVLGHLLPIVVPFDCGHTAPLHDAGAWIRILHDGAPKSGSRLIGRVYLGVPYDRRRRKPAPGTYVNLVGANWTIVSVADGDGVYDFADLPPGTYTLRTQVTISDGRVFSDVQSFRLKEAEVRDWDIYAR